MSDELIELWRGTRNGRRVIILKILWNLQEFAQTRKITTWLSN